MVNGGLIIKNVTGSDGGLYGCVYKNDVGSVSHSITVRYHEEPVISCAHAGTVVRIHEGRNLEIKCNVTGFPEPKVAWLLNGFSVKNDSKINATSRSIYFKPIEKTHAGNLQIFARNSVKTIYKSISLRVVPLSTSDIPKNSHRHAKTSKNGRKFAKHGKNKNLEMIPPSKPVITRVNDETVMVRWQVNDNEGLPIRFFKVQYRELGPAGNYSNRSKGWKTMNADIPPTSKDYEVKNLKPDYIYKFRVAAVYSNDDNNNSVNSDKFHLRRLDFEERNPLPVPTITRTASINSSSVKIFWEYTPNPNITVEGFYISYLSSSKAGDFMTATVDGAHVTSHIISHLQPDMFYDFKLQTFNSKSASEFSPIMPAKTKALPVVATTQNPSTHVTPTTTKTTTNKLYIFVAVGVVVAALIVSLVVILFVCRKWKQKKSLDNNKGPVEEHHIQADGNEYVVSPKTLPRANGCGLPTNRITITANPLADADNKNDVGSVSHSITVRYHEEPVISCAHAGTVVRIHEGRNLEIKCNVTGFPEPKVAWLLNGFSVKNDSKINATSRSIYFKPIEKTHAGNLQIFARNSVKTIYKSISLRVVPLSTSDIPKNSHRHAKTSKNGRKFAKHGKNKNLEMIPPSKPVITRVNDETVMVRWQVNDNEGLPIRFFKVQYRELGPAGNYSNRSKGWKTMNADIPPTSKDYEVKNLKPDYIYKFRVAAVYSNDDNNNSVNSDKFHLRRLDFEERNPLPVPTITRTASINSSSVKIFWEYTPNPNITVEGFYISYLSSSKAGDFMTATVDGAHVTSHIISHLQPDMFYDFKLQTFNSKSASEFSPIMPAKTKALPVVATTQNPSTHVTPTTTKTTTNKLYIFVAVGVVVAALIVSLVVILFVCRKKSLDNNKGPVEEHHIQADGNEYVVSPKTLPRANGCGLPTNRITITANPLADADNKNQNLIEMSCMTAQNNNLTQQPQPPSTPPPIEETAKNRDKTKRNNKRSLVESGENYV